MWRGATVWSGLLLLPQQALQEDPVERVLVAQGLLQAPEELIILIDHSAASSKERKR